MCSLAHVQKGKGMVQIVSDTQIISGLGVLVELFVYLIIGVIGVLVSPSFKARAICLRASSSSTEKKRRISLDEKLCDEKGGSFR